MSDSLEEITSGLSLAEILQLKEKCSKKVFHNFLAKNYAKDAGQKQPKSKSADPPARPDQTSSSKPNRKSREDAEFEEVFGCTRNKNVRLAVRASQLNPDLVGAAGGAVEPVDPKDRPEERSTKIRPTKLRTIFHSGPKDEAQRRDPRFEQTAGYFNQTRFDKSYGFLKEAREKDKQTLKRKLGKLKDEEKRLEVSKVIQRIENQEKSEKQRAQKAEVKQKLIAEKRERLQRGRRQPADGKAAPEGRVFVNKSELKKKELVEKFKTLQKTAGLNKYLERKRKKNTAKERKVMFKDGDQPPPS